MRIVSYHLQAFLVSIWLVDCVVEAHNGVNTFTTSIQHHNRIHWTKYHLSTVRYVKIDRVCGLASCDSN